MEEDKGIPPADDHASLTHDADALLAKELSSLTMEEREKSYYDIHGVSDVIDESPEFVAEKLAQMDEELAQIADKDACLQAASQNKDYVTSRQLGLKFLRAECFDPKLAAERLVRFFQEKLNLFGAEKLTKDIKLSDLDEDDIRCLNAGIGQILPLRDRAGRSILAWIPMTLAGEAITEKTTQNRVRGIHRVWSSAL
jgi:hypothetical protein